MRLSVIPVLLALALAAGRAYADVYTWEDESGTVHFSDEPPATSRRARKVVLPKDAPAPEPKETAVPAAESARRQAPAQPPAPPKVDARKPPPTVELFTTSWCPYCKRARAFFQEKGIPVIEHDIEREAGARDRLLALTGREAVPAALIGDKLVLGFSPSEYQAALGLR